MSKMNPKEVFHNTAYSVQLPYIAGHSLFFAVLLLAVVKVILLWIIMKYKSWLPCLKIISSTEKCGKEKDIYRNP